MTCRERLKIEHPDKVSDIWTGGCEGCPSNLQYLPDPDYCPLPNMGRANNELCAKCWDREIPEEKKEDKNMEIKDSGARREFETGAVRDIQEGKGRCDLMPIDVIEKYLKGALVIRSERDGEPPLFGIAKFQDTGDVYWLYQSLFSFTSRNYSSDHFTMLLELSKHFEEGAKKYGENNWQKGIPVHCYIDSAVRHYLKFMRGDDDEPHDRAFCWNIVCAIWTCVHKSELNDYRKDDAECNSKNDSGK